MNSSAKLLTMNLQVVVQLNYFQHKTKCTYPIYLVIGTFHRCSPTNDIFLLTVSSSANRDSHAGGKWLNSKYKTYLDYVTFIFTANNIILSRKETSSKSMTFPECQPFSLRIKVGTNETKIKTKMVTHFPQSRSYMAFWYKVRIIFQRYCINDINSSILFEIRVIEWHLTWWDGTWQETSFVVSCLPLLFFDDEPSVLRIRSKKRFYVIVK